MESFFDSNQAHEFAKAFADFPPELALRCYTARLIGQNTDLVLHGGGNSSVKIISKNIFGEDDPVIFVKGSGQDLAKIDPHGFSGLRLKPLRKLIRLETLADEAMQDQLRIHRISATAPTPSVESLLHAFLPQRYVDHTHADSILTLTNLEHGAKLLKEILGNGVAIIPYIASGFPLAKAVLASYEQNCALDAIVVLNHGIFTFAEHGRDAYEKMVAYVNRAEEYIEDRCKGRSLGTLQDDLNRPADYQAALARCAQVIRGVCSRHVSIDRPTRFYVAGRNSPELIAASLAKEAKTIAVSGVLTPDHCIRTGNASVYIESVPQNDDDLKDIVDHAVKKHIADYQKYFSRHSKSPDQTPNKLDAGPRLFLVAGLGLIAIGETCKAAHIAADIGEHTIRAKLRAMALGKYRPISEAHVFDMEYWGLQRKKIDPPPLAPLAGQVALVTGGGGAIGYGIAERLLNAGAAVVISDIDPQRLEKVHAILVQKYAPDCIEMRIFDVSEYEAVVSAMEEICIKFGGIDLLVPNAGIAHVARIEDLDPVKLDHVIAVNLKGTFTVIKAAIPVFKRQATGGNIVVISSKNVFDPGAAFAAYSASKAGAHQISKIAAVELAELGVRVNMINPDAVFGDENVCSGLWELVGPDRMQSRGLAPENLQEYYCQRSLLKVQVLAEHVGNAVVFFASDLTPTTGASLPVDAGNPAAFPR